jgi:two-component system sensor histidine kinase SenX3
VSFFQLKHRLVSRDDLRKLRELIATAPALGRSRIDDSELNVLAEAITSLQQQQSAERRTLTRALATLLLAGEGGAAGRGSTAASAEVAEARYEHLRSDFVAAASHELKTPVAGIELLGEALVLALSDSDYKAAAEFATQITTETANLRRLLEDLLDLARLEENPAADTVSDLCAAIDSVAALHRRLIEKKGLQFHVIGAPSGAEVATEPEENAQEKAQAPLLARASATDLAIILDNLLDNALRYTACGSIELRVGQHGSHQVYLSVSDTGSGIAPAEQERIFERFDRADQSRNRQSGGTGLGLALVKNAVERRGGSVTVKSSPGEGSTFTVLLPRA